MLGGTRRLLADFASRIIVASMSYYRLPGATPHQEHTLSGDELIVSVEIPAGAYTSRSHYLKVRDRESYEFALVSVAAALHEEGGVIRAARLAAGGVGTGAGAGGVRFRCRAGTCHPA